MNPYNNLSKKALTQESNNLQYLLGEVIHYAQSSKAYDQRKLAIAKTSLETAQYWLNDALTNYSTDASGE